MTETAIVLCGGLAKRMRPLTDEKPKCMIPVNGKTIMQRIVEWLRSHGIKNIIVACGHKWEKIKEVYGDELIYSVESEPLGTAGAVKKALQFVKEEEFFIINGDDLADLDLTEMQKLGSPTISVAHFHSNLGIVDLDGSKVLGFKEKPILPFWANMGFYLLDKKISLPDKGSLEQDVFPKVQLKAYRHEGYWLIINTTKDLEEAEKFLKSIEK